MRDLCVISTAVIVTITSLVMFTMPTRAEELENFSGLGSAITASIRRSSPLVLERRLPKSSENGSSIWLHGKIQ